MTTDRKQTNDGILRESDLSLDVRKIGAQIASEIFAESSAESLLVFLFLF